MKIRETLADGLYKCLMVLGLGLLPAAVALAAEQATPFAPDGYRIDDFRSPVPDRSPGTQTVDTAAVKALIESTDVSAVLIDVLPQAPRPQRLSATALWLPPERYNIPGSVWLPNVGYGRLSEELENYFQANLQRLTGGDLARPVVIYCQADCWMSWNAARRAAEYGYRNVMWYPEGTDDWAAAQLPLALSAPVPIH